MGLTAGFEGVSSGRGVLLAFDQDAAFKPGSCTNQGDQMGPSDRASASLGGLDELENHGQDGGRAARVTGDLGAEFYRDEVDWMGLVVRRHLTMPTRQAAAASSVGNAVFSSNSLRCWTQ